MRCPYCASEIDDAALACPHCTRDLYLFKPLLARIGDLEARLASLEAGGHRKGESGAPAEALLMEPDLPQSLRLRDLLKLVAVPLLLLLLAHLLTTIVYDANTIYLRILSLIIPLPFGFLLTASAARRMAVVVPAALSVALLSVLGMSVVTAAVDNVAVLPADLREWREFLEYAASVAFSYATGTILGNMSRRRGRVLMQQGAMSVALARLVSNGAESTVRFQSAVKKFNDFGGALTAAATTAASIYMGLQGLIK